MKCSDARHLIHLAAGDDNLPDEEQALAEHLHSCADCRSYSAGMTDAMQVLQKFRHDTTVVDEVSIWPDVERRIRERRTARPAVPAEAPDRRQPKRQFHGGVVALCACSLVLAFITIVQSLPVNDAMNVQMLSPDFRVNVGTVPRLQPGAGQAGSMPSAPVFVPVMTDSAGRPVMIPQALQQTPSALPADRQTHSF